MRSILLLALLLSGTAASGAPRLTGDLPRKDARPLEALAGVDTEYGSVRTSEGVRLRTIVTRPAGSSGKLPAIFHTQAVSCGSLELPTDRPTMLGELARRSGMVLIRVERAGTGDSEGPACEAFDYDTEVRHYREAFDALARHQWVDPNKMFIVGSSLGSTTAPLVAEGKKVAGIAVQGGGALTYLERMIGFDRLYLERSGKYRPEAIHDEMVKRIAFHQLYLIGRKTPAQIAAERPDLAGVWASIRGGAEAPPHYGRPYAWHWQAAAKNFLGAWATIEAPVLVGYAPYDQFEPLQSHAVIVDTVNRLRPGTAQLVMLDGLDHSLRRYPDALAAYREEGGEPGREAWLEPLIAWLKETAR
ncbi:CocE/NonD family hydrolase [Sphingomonas sp.]|uniref:alpha/beta hydrolase family protein n=1 Tax=Sphingomonas sp. TaxID=28214 RepID=UPI00286EAB0C|nr:CocE/NonD family hydrolase [Sphingomonas sp.]